MADEPRTNRGRPRFGAAPKPKVIKFSTSLPPDIYDRLEKFCADDERDKAWVIRKAVEKWLTEKVTLTTFPLPYMTIMIPSIHHRTHEKL